MNAPLVESLGLPMVGVHSMVRRASQSVIGAELAHLKDSMGYTGGGSWQAYRDETLSKRRSTWPEFCKEQAGISERAAVIYFQCWEEVKIRLKEEGLPGSKELLALMEQRPSALTSEARQGMLYEIIRLGFNEGENQADIRRSYRRRTARVVARKPEAPQVQDSEELLGQNMEALAIGSGMCPRTASLVRLVLRAHEDQKAKNSLEGTTGNPSHE